jgi:fructosamine-3-kinase
LEWLRVPGGVAIVEVLSVEANSLALQRLSPTAPTPAMAEDFGRTLAVTHAAGAQSFGVGPSDWTGDGFQGPADQLIPLCLQAYSSWGSMYADLRVEPLAAAEPALLELAQPVLRRLRAGEFDGSCDGPARLHGDLWSGNVMWTANGAVLIDPAAHSGHPESDLAALALFGTPHLERALASYDEAAGLADGWRSRVPLMQLHLVLLHAILFGGGYVEAARSILRRYS